MPQLDVAFFPSQILWLALTFLMLYFYMKRHVLPKIDSIVLRRNDAINGNAVGYQQLQDQILALEKQCTDASLQTNQQVELLHRNMLNDFNKFKQERINAIENDFIAKQLKQHKIIQDALSNIKKDLPEAVIGCSILVLDKVTGIVPNINAIKACYDTLDLQSKN